MILNITKQNIFHADLFLTYGALMQMSPQNWTVWLTACFILLILSVFFVMIAHWKSKPTGKPGFCCRPNEETYLLHTPNLHGRLRQTPTQMPMVLGSRPRTFGGWRLVRQSFIDGFMPTDLFKCIHRQHWIQRITFTAKTNAANTHTCSMTDGRRATQYILHSLSDGGGNYLQSSQALYKQDPWTKKFMHPVTRDNTSSWYVSVLAKISLTEAQKFGLL